MSKPAIFISYRRDDSQSQARSLSTELSCYFGKEEVFFDKKIPPGDVWDTRLKEKVQNSKIFIVVIVNTDKWLGVGKRGVLRIKDENDWVRNEISLALESESITVIPVLFDNAEMPEVEFLGDISELSKRQFIRVREDELSTDIGELVRQISDITGLADISHLREKMNDDSKDLKLDHPVIRCDRESQLYDFRDARISDEIKKPKLFYLFGHEDNVPESFVKRIKSEFLEFKDTKPASIKYIELTIPVHHRSPRIQMIADLCISLGLDPRKLAPLDKKKIFDILGQALPKSSDTPVEYLIIFTKINGYDWSPKNIPELARWFITDFCNQSDMPDLPEIIFFVSMEYHEDFTGMEDEINHVIRGADDYAFVLPEFEKVHYIDIEKWIMTQYNSSSRSQTRNIITKHFGESAASGGRFYMREVQEKLRKVIQENLKKVTE